ncbi:ATP dependent DNA helicase [Gigaspora margarita]|uniref:ATP dependent DNA helicase n=1 Tax=Gigaspora margarita TaxID=4874 RepID=A0A8H4A2Y9_GIGMA|nr:ATP dependent DNA helicase [Gigaspora margarita]
MNLNYSQNLLSINPNRIKYLCNNQSVFVREDSKFMKILPDHENLSNRSSIYQLLKIPDIQADYNEKVYVLFIPGYCIFTCLGGHFFKLKLKYNNDKNCILYEWVDFGTDYKFENPIIFKSLPDNLSSLCEYLQTNPVIEYKGTLSMPFILGFTCGDNVKWLREYIAN